MSNVFTTIVIPRVHGTYKARVGGWEGGRVAIELKGGYTFHWDTGSSAACVFNKSQKQAQSTGSTKTAVDSSLAPHIHHYTMPFTGSTGPVVHLHDLRGSAKRRL